MDDVGECGKMVFSNLFFIYLFLPLNLILYFISKNKTWRNVVLLLFSLFFYAWGEPVWVFLLLVCAGLAVLLIWHRCPYCGKGLKFGARPCTHCGSSLEDCGHIQQNREPPASVRLPRSHIRAERLRWVLYVPLLIGLVFSPFAEWWSYPMTIAMLGGYLLVAVVIARVWMRCPHCGKPLKGGETYCPRCGGKLER